MLYLVKIDSINRKYTAEPYTGTETLPEGVEVLAYSVTEPGVTCLLASDEYLKHCQSSVSMSWPGRYDTVEVELERIDC